MVLLKNDDALPLSPSAGTVAVVGPLADTLYTDWYSGKTPYQVTPRAGIAARLDGTVTGSEAVDRIALRSLDTGGYVTAGSGVDGAALTASGASAGPDQQFDVFDWGQGVATLRSVANGKYVERADFGADEPVREPGPAAEGLVRAAAVHAGGRRRRRRRRQVRRLRDGQRLGGPEQLPDRRAGRPSSSSAPPTRPARRGSPGDRVERHRRRGGGRDRRRRGGRRGRQHAVHQRPRGPRPDHHGARREPVRADQGGARGEPEHGRGGGEQLPDHADVGAGQRARRSCGPRMPGRRPGTRSRTCCSATSTRPGGSRRPGTGPTRDLPDILDYDIIKAAPDLPVLRRRPALRVRARPVLQRLPVREADVSSRRGG